MKTGVSSIVLGIVNEFSCVRNNVWYTADIILSQSALRFRCKMNPL